MGSERVASLTLGGGSAQSAAVDNDNVHDHDYLVAREPPGALAERSGSERWPDIAAARSGRVGPA